MSPAARILVVEDESIVAFNLQQRLTHLGYDVPSIAVSGQECMEQVATTQPDLVLMDIHIQGDMDGIDVASRLQREHTVPVIYLTAYSEDSTLERARETQPYGYLLKPFSERELHASIQMALERHRLGTELEHQRRLLQQALDAASLGILEVDGQQALITTTPRSAELIGAPHGEPLTVAQLLERVHQNEREALAANLERSLKELQRFSQEFRLHAEGTAERWIKLDATGTAAQRVAGVVQDVSERKHSEQRLRMLKDGLEDLVTERTAELRQSVKELEAFSYSVAHDLRSPVRSVISISQELQSHPDRLEPDELAMLQGLTTSAQRMGELIDALLNMARMNQLPMQRRVVDLGLMAREIVHALAESEPGRRVELNVAPNLKTMADPALVRSLLDNLIGNAWKFSARRDITRIDVGAREASGETVYFVRDNGCGFDMAAAERLFGPFQRLHRASDYAGTGIGLTIVQRIVMRHGGRIWAYSEPGLGAAFHFTLAG